MSDYLNVTTQEQLSELLDRLATKNRIGVDTEFVSEGRYEPELCLVQVATDQELALIDPLVVGDMTPFWELLVEGSFETIWHAGRSELEFCLRATKRRPARLFDTQIAAGLVGVEYPAGFRTLLSKLLNRSASKAETRTDWRRRPLSDRQIDYALDDVRYLMSMRDELQRRLERMGRTAWLVEEMQLWLDGVEHSLSAQRWRRTSGCSGLKRRQLAIVREVWRWREHIAKSRNCPAKRVLRDDMIVELAKRGTADSKRIQALRGMQRGDLKQAMPKLADAIQQALDLPEDDCPKVHRGGFPPQFNVLGQFMFSALTSVCRAKEVASGLVGSATDVRELIAHHTGHLTHHHEPRLAVGWRAEVVGRSFEDLLSGKTAIRVTDPASDHPLEMMDLES